MQDRFLRLEEVERMVGFHYSTIYRRIQKGEFPAPIKIGTSSRWRLLDVSAWMEKVVNRAA
ncbi:AlpA family transcriptional regulator [Chromobacterium sp. LK1]|uniref:helix-turn-helix transcriptional regulator n=1 Tax=Chromobacterium sp. LK1 TaxID=1628193 RepID=UPI0009E19E6A|nr:AlpA family phage regulatory protein [Chromobacterium sp. LK1]